MLVYVLRRRDHLGHMPAGNGNPVVVHKKESGTARLYQSAIGSGVAVQRTGELQHFFYCLLKHVWAAININEELRMQDTSSRETF